jgi:hypothetical protein
MLPQCLAAQSTIGTIPLPDSIYKRVQSPSGSFAAWLRNLSLKKPGSAVTDFHGGIFKTASDTAVAAVIDWSIQGKRLEQCMDIVVRFYAEYLWKEDQLNDLNLPLPGGYWLAWDHWKTGNRPQFKGVDVYMTRSFPPDSTYSTFNSFLKTVFNLSHTQQFYHAYQPVKKEDVRIGDFIVKKGTKGHAVLIVDLAQSSDGKMIALIGNGDTPACEFFLLNHKNGDPWIPIWYEQESLPLPLRRKMTWDGLRRFSLPRR